MGFILIQMSKTSYAFKRWKQYKLTWQLLLTLQWTTTLEFGRPSCFTPLFGGNCFTLVVSFLYICRTIQSWLSVFGFLLMSIGWRHCCSSFICSEPLEASNLLIYLLAFFFLFTCLLNLNHDSMTLMLLLQMLKKLTKQLKWGNSRWNQISTLYWATISGYGGGVGTTRCTASTTSTLEGGMSQDLVCGMACFGTPCYPSSRPSASTGTQTTWTKQVNPLFPLFFYWASDSNVVLHCQNSTPMGAKNDMSVNKYILDEQCVITKSCKSTTVQCS
jgi:hypothetical protein